MTTVKEGASANIVWKKNVIRNGKLRVMCRYDGNIVSVPQTKSLRYVGGDTRIVAVPPSAESNFVSLVSHLAGTLGISYVFKLKYQLPDHELDSLISVETDEDVQIMMEEHGYVNLSYESLIPQSRIRLFIFPSKLQRQVDPVMSKPVTGIDWLGIEDTKPQPVLQHPKTETWFVDALKSAERMQSGRDNSGSSGGSGDGNGGICGQESLLLETNSSFGSTASSVSASKLPPMKSTTGEDNTGNSQVKYAPIESATRDNAPLTPVSYQELPTRQNVLENKVPSNLYEAELNKPVPIPVSGYPPFLNQAHQQQPMQVVYTANPPVMLPPYQHSNQIRYQFPPPPPPQPQPYRIYYVPVEQYRSGHVQALPMNPATVGSQVVHSPLAPELASQVYLPPKPVDPSAQSSSEVCRDDFIYNTDLVDDTVHAQIYKSQPPAPVMPSEYQAKMLD